MRRIGFFLALAITTTGCVSTRRYRRDVDDAEIHGEAKMLIEAAILIGSNVERDDALYHLNGLISVLQMRRINRALGLYEYPEKRR